MNFLDPQLTSDGQPYAPHKLKDIIKQRYYISKYTNTSYSDVGKLTIIERDNLLQLIHNDLKVQHDAIEQARKLKK